MALGLALRFVTAGVTHCNRWGYFLYLNLVTKEKKEAIIFVTKFGYIKSRSEHVEREEYLSRSHNNC